MKLFLLASLILAGEPRVSSVDALISYAVPEGWTAEAFKDSVLLEGDVERIGIRRDASMARHLKLLGLKEKEGKALQVAGKKALRFTRSVPRFVASAHGGKLTAAQAKETMLEHTVFLPTGGGAALVFRTEEKRERAWPALEAFLKTVRFKSKSR